MFTQCPHCQTAFRISAEILRQANGKVRCGNCSEAFNALDHLFGSPPREEDDTTPPSDARDDAALLQALESFPGPADVRIEDTGSEWRLIDDEDEDNAADGEQGGDRSVLRWLVEDDAPAEADDTGDQPAIGVGDANEPRYDDNSPLPEGVDDDEDQSRDDEDLVTLQFPQRRASDEYPMRRAGDPLFLPPEPDAAQTDFELSTPDDWADLLDEFRPAPDAQSGTARAPEESDNGNGAAAGTNDETIIDFELGGDPSANEAAVSASADALDAVFEHGTDDDAVIDFEIESTAERLAEADTLDAGFYGRDRAQVPETELDFEIDATGPRPAVTDTGLPDGKAGTGEPVLDFELETTAVHEQAAGSLDEMLYAEDAAARSDTFLDFDLESTATPSVVTPAEFRNARAGDDADGYDANAGAVESMPVDGEQSGAASDNAEPSGGAARDGDDDLDPSGRFERAIASAEIDLDDDTDGQGTDARTGPAAADPESGTDFDFAAATANLKVDPELLRAALEGDAAAAAMTDADGTPLVETVILEGDAVHDALDAERDHERPGDGDAESLIDTYISSRMASGRRFLDGRGSMIAAAVLLAILLIAQFVHHQRETLVTRPLVGDTVASVYRALGASVVPEWNVRGWQFEATRGATGEDDTTLTISSRLSNRARKPLPYPLIHVSLTDRYEEIIGSKVLPPADYLAADADSGRRLAAGENFTATITVAEIPEEATGFKLNVCYRESVGRVRCAIEAFK